MVKHMTRRINKGKTATPTLISAIEKTRKKAKLNSKHAAIFLPDTEATVSIVPWKVTMAHNLEIKQVDLNKPEIVSASNHPLKLDGRVEFYLSFAFGKHSKRVKGLIQRTMMMRQF